jgi:hypothetical protein
MGNASARPQAMMSVEERTYRGWRAAAVTFGFLSIGFLIWGLVLVNFADCTIPESTTIRSSFSHELTNSNNNASTNMQIIDDLLTRRRAALEEAKQIESEASAAKLSEIKEKLAQAAAKDLDSLQVLKQRFTREE